MLLSPRCCFVAKLERIAAGFKSSRVNDELDAPNSAGAVRFKAESLCYCKITLGRLEIAQRSMC